MKTLVPPSLLLNIANLPVVNPVKLAIISKANEQWQYQNSISMYLMWFSQYWSQIKFHKWIYDYSWSYGCMVTYLSQKIQNLPEFHWEKVWLQVCILPIIHSYIGWLKTWDHPFPSSNIDKFWISLLMLLMPCLNDQKKNWVQL